MAYCYVHFVTLKIIPRKASAKKSTQNQKRNVVIFYIYHTQKKFGQMIKEVVVGKVTHAYYCMYIFVVVGKWHEVLFKEMEQAAAAVIYCPRSNTEQRKYREMQTFKWDVVDDSVMVRCAYP